MPKGDYLAFKEHQEKKHDCTNGWMYDLLDELEEKRVREIVKDELNRKNRRIN